MKDLSRGKLAIKYMTFELLPVFLMGLSVFVFILVMFQSFKLSEYIIIHGAKLSIVAKLVFYLTLGYLPILFPIALLFTVLMVYGRLSGDSEIVAFKSLGLSPIHLLTPVLIVSVSIAILSLQASFRLAPWGQRNFDQLVSLLAQTRPATAIREGVFSEGFFDLVVYANTVDSRSGTLEKIFIFDERNPTSPVTIIAKKGELVNTNSISGQQAFLRLNDGNLHKSSNEFYTKIDFKTYDINLFDAHEIRDREISPDAMNLAELKEALEVNSSNAALKTKLQIEWNRRWAMSATCIVFAVLGFSLGAITNRRTAKSGTLVICISSVVIFWTLLVGLESLVKSNFLPPALGAWGANALFAAYALYRLKTSGQN